ncbi:hypothetical protein LguiB_031185 [Lonicera macranthoides]
MCCPVPMAGTNCCGHYRLEQTALPCYVRVQIKSLKPTKLAPVDIFFRFFNLVCTIERGWFNFGLVLRLYN